MAVRNHRQHQRYQRCKECRGDDGQVVGHFVFRFAPTCSAPSNVLVERPRAGLAAHSRWAGSRDRSRARAVHGSRPLQRRVRCACNHVEE
jgi:hypothetical protein